MFLNIELQHYLNGTLKVFAMSFQRWIYISQCCNSTFLKCWFNISTFVCCMEYL